jgi:RNA polymerase sigma-70 factor (ECF subfamily)
VFREYAAPLSRLAQGLLPARVRSMTDAQDVVQDVLASTARQLPHLDCPDDRALFAYMRRAVRHRVVDEIRRAARRPLPTMLLEDCPATGPSPLDAAIRSQNERRVRVALGHLRGRDRRAVVLRLWHARSYQEIAVRMGMPTANAARVAIRRALVRLNEVLDDTN